MSGERAAPEPQAWAFEIDEPTPSLNMLRRQFANARYYTTLRNRLETYVMVARVNNKIPKATKIRRVYITRYATQEKYLLDLDNFIGGAKPLLDVLVRQGLLVDDSAKFLNCYYEQRVGAVSCTHVKIEEMEEQLIHSGEPFAACFAEDELIHIFITKTIEEASAYAKGFAKGGSAYGAGSCFALVWPTEAAELAKLPKAQLDQIVTSWRIVLNGRKKL